MQQLKSRTGIISIGNTGLRVKNPFSEHKEMLESLNKFRSEVPQGWSQDDQISFANFHNNQELSRYIKTNNITSADKDVRLKLAFLGNLGFIDKSRQLTEVGKAYLDCSDTTSTNEWGLSSSSMLFLTQFLKWQWEGVTELKPILSLIYCCLEFDNELPYNFLKYFWTTAKTKTELDKDINLYKQSNFELEELLSYKYKESDTFSIFSKNLSKIDIKDVCDSKKLKDYFCQKFIVPHGKSNQFLIPTYEFFIKLLNYWENMRESSLEKKKKYIWKEIQNKKNAIKSSLSTTIFHNSLFGKKLSSVKKINHDDIAFFENTNLMKADNKLKFLEEFHLIYMLLSIHNNVSEYEDLNFRHLKLLGIFFIDYKTVKLRIHFKYLFENKKNDLFLDSNFLSKETGQYQKKLQEKNDSFEDIYTFLDEDFDTLLERVKIAEPLVKKYGIKEFEQTMRMKKLEDLIEMAWTKKNLISILEILNENLSAEKRDSVIHQQIEKFTGNKAIASGPAILEYLISLSFYQISNGKIQLRSLVENLDENALPTHHEQGGKPDITFDYKSKSYMCEVTLQNDDGQRKMESEPVPRHLANHMLNINNNALCFFIAPKLNPNNLVVLRSYKRLKWYGPDNQIINSMNIFPLELKDLINCLKNEDGLENILEKVELLIESEETDGYVWYKNEIEPAFK